MNQLGTTLIWCIAQVTLLSLAACGAYMLLRRFGPRAGALVIMTGMALIVGLSLLMFSPWPRWMPVADFHETTTISQTSIDVSNSMTPPPTSIDVSNTLVPSDVAPDVSARVEAQPEPVPERPSAAALLLETLGDELLRPRPRPTTEPTARRWPMVLVALLSAGVLLGSIRLLLGLIVVVRYRRRSRILEEPSLTAMVDILLAELGCRRRLELRESDALTGAATVGWRHPLILLPRTWRDWSEEQLRAVLAHEIAHVHANDFLAGLLGQIGLALHFYHPLVHWLMGRLRLEQELAADAVAARLSGGRRTYLTTIAAMALEQEDRNVGWPARAFLPAKSTFLRRIAMLRDSRFRIAPISTGVRVMSITLMLLLGLAVAGLRPPTTDRAIAEEPAASTKAEEVASTETEETPATEAADRIASGKLDLAYVLDEPGIVAVVRPAEILARLKQFELHELAMSLPIMRELHFQHVFDLDFEEIEQLTMVVYLGHADAGIAATHLWVIRLTEPYSLDELIEQRVANAEKKTYRGKAYYFCRGSFAGPCYQPDARTLVLGQSMGSLDSRSLWTELMMCRLIDAGPDSRPAIEREDAWQAVCQSQGAVLLTGKGTSMMSREMSRTAERTGRSDQPETAFLAWLPGLFEDVRDISAGVRWDDELSVRAFASCKNEAAADDLKDTLVGFEAMGRTSLKAQLRSPETSVALVGLGNELLAALAITKDGSQIRVETTISADREWSEMFAEEFVKARQAAHRATSMNNLKQLGLAMHNHHATHECFPPPILLGPDGKTPYSWRVAILPYIEQQDLYDAYDFNEPWDGPNNRKLLERIPSPFRHPSEPDDTTTCAYYVLTGPETSFGIGSTSRSNRGVCFADMSDGTSNTLMLVEAKRDIPWTKPEDIPYDVDRPIPELGGFSEGGFHAALCDGSVRFWPEEIDEKTLRRLIMKSDGEPIDFDAIPAR